MTQHRARPINTVQDVQDVLSSMKYSFVELLDCVRVARSFEDWPLVERVGTLLLAFSSTSASKHLPSLQEAARSIVTAIIARVESFDRLEEGLSNADRALVAIEADVPEKSRQAVAAERSWLNELRMLYADATPASMVSLCSHLRKVDRADLGVQAASIVLKERPDDVGALTTRAAALADQGDHPRALTDIARAWKRQPSSFVANTYSRICLLAGRPEMALEFAEEAFRRSPDEYSARTLLAAAARAEDQDAMGKAKAVIVEHGDDGEEATSAWVEKLAIQFLLEEGKLDEAEGALRALAGEGRVPWQQIKPLEVQLKKARGRQQTRLEL